MFVLKVKLFRKKIEPSCMYCSYGKRHRESERVFCQKKGIVDAFGSCKKFSYDSLKRIPKKVDFSSDLSKEDFEL